MRSVHCAEASARCTHAQGGMQELEDVEKFLSRGR